MTSIACALLLAMAAQIPMPQSSRRPPAAPPPSVSLPELIARLADPSWEARRETLAEIGYLRANGRAAGPAVAELVRSDPEAAVRTKAAEVLGLIGADPSIAVPTLVKALEDKSDAVVHSAVFALAMLDRPEARGAAPQVRVLLKRPDREMRVIAARGLALLGDHGDDTAAVLREALRDKDRDLPGRMAVVRALTKVAGPERARPDVLPVIEEALAGPDQALAKGATAALGSLGPPSIPRLIEVAKTSGHLPVRLAALQALRRQGEAARPYVPQIREITAFGGRVGQGAEALVRMLESGGPMRRGRRSRMPVPGAPSPVPASPSRSPAPASPSPTPASPSPAPAPTPSPVAGS